jgi:uncharacterized membrane protein YphA (DoxX/SURF4 family)
MAYSHARLRKTLALVRILTGVVFLVMGQYKISSLEFARVGFPQFLAEAVQGRAVSFYGSLLSGIHRTSPFAVTLGLMEMFIGVGLVLGLAVRPISLLGMFYMVNLMLATWMTPGPDAPLWAYLQGEFGYLCVFFLFLLFGIGHAGENWGLGAVYHHRRHLRWEQPPAEEPVPQQPPEDQFFPEASYESEHEEHELRVVGGAGQRTENW